MNKDVENFVQNKTYGTRSTMSILINGDQYVSDHKGSMISNS